MPQLGHASTFHLIWRSSLEMKLKEATTTKVSLKENWETHFPKRTKSMID